MNCWTRSPKAATTALPKAKRKSCSAYPRRNKAAFSRYAHHQDLLSLMQLNFQLNNYMDLLIIQRALLCVYKAFNYISVPIMQLKNLFIPILLITCVSAFSQPAKMVSVE